MDQIVFENSVFVLKDDMYRFAKRFLLSQDEAQDVVQDLMIKFWNMKSDLHKYNNLKSFIMRCVKNECLNRLKHHEIVTKHAEVEYKTSEQYQINTNNINEEIIKLINLLPEKQRIVIQLRDIEDYDINEIAEVLEIEENAVRVNLMRARNKIKEQLTKLFDYENQRIQNSSL